MIFTKYNIDNKVTFQHFMPFDEKHGLGKTKEELLLEGILIESNPEITPPIVGKKNVLYVNPLRWVYEDRPLTQAEKLAKMVIDGILTQEQADDLLK